MFVYENTLLQAAKTENHRAQKEGKSANLKARAEAEPNCLSIIKKNEGILIAQ